MKVNKLLATLALGGALSFGAGSAFAASNCPTVNVNGDIGVSTAATLESSLAVLNAGIAGASQAGGLLEQSTVSGANLAAVATCFKAVTAATATSNPSAVAGGFLIFKNIPQPSSVNQAVNNIVAQIAQNVGISNTAAILSQLGFTG